MDPTIGLATVEDIEELARLRWQLYTEEASPVAETLESYRDRFSAFALGAIGDPAWTIWVARLDDLLVGAAWRYRTPRIPRPGRWEPAPLAYVTNVYVEPTLRDRGLGARLLRAVVDASRSEDYSLAIVWPSERSDPFYRRAGFARERDPLTIDLDHGGGSTHGTGHQAVRPT